MIRPLFLTTLCSFLSIPHPGKAADIITIPTTPTATLNLGPILKSFGTVILDSEPKALETPFRNSSGQTYTGLSVTFTGPEASAFSAELPVKIEPNQEGLLRFRFTPQKVGPHGAKATLSWTGQTGPAPEFHLGGTGAYGAKATLRFPEFSAYSNNTALAELPNGNILMAACSGSEESGFTSIVRELRPDGSETDMWAKFTVQGKIQVIAVQSDGKFLIGGRISSVSMPLSDNSVVSGQLARLGQMFRFQPDGTYDTAFNALWTIPPQGEEPLEVRAIVVQPDGRIIVGGKGSVGLQRHLIRLNADGLGDTQQPLPTPDGAVNALSVLADGRVMVGGAFQHLGESPAPSLVRLKVDGSIDPGFTNYNYRLVTALASRADKTAIAGLGGNVESQEMWPLVSMESATAGHIQGRQFATIPVTSGTSSESLRAFAPRAVSILESGDVVAVLPQPAQITETTPPPVFHLQDPTFGGTMTNSSPRQFFQGQVHAVLQQRDGKVLVAGEMIQAAQYGYVISNVIGPTSTMAPLIPSSNLTGFAQLNGNGFYDDQPLAAVSGLQSYSDGLSTARIGNVPLYLDAYGTISVTFSGPDADQFAVSQEYSWLYLRPCFCLPNPIHFDSETRVLPVLSPPGQLIIGWPIYDPSSRWIIHAKSNRPGPLHAVAHIQNPQLMGSSQNTFDLALEAGFEPGPLSQLEVKEATNPTVLSSGALAQFPNTSVGATAQRTYLLKNNNAEVLPLSFEMTGAQPMEFQLSTNSVELNPGQSTLLTVTFRPTVSGQSQAKLEIRRQFLTLFLGPRIDPDWHFEIRLLGSGIIGPASLITPANHIARLDESVSFEVPASIEESPAYQWFRDQKPISGATGRSLTLEVSTLADAGSYQVRVQRPDGPMLSTPARLAVLGNAPSSQSFVLGKPVKLSQPFRGSGLQFQWLKDGVALSDTTVIKGSRSALLTLTAPKPADAVTYTCLVTLGDAQLTGAAIQLNPVLPPVITLASERFNWTVGQTVSEQITTTGPATRFAVVGLPPGVRLNMLTGALTGIPLKAGEFTLRITAINEAGPSTVQQIPVTIAPLGLYETGSFMGVLAREESIGSGRGGLLNLTITATGAYTGNLSYYAEPNRRMTLVFRGQLQWNAEGKPTVRAWLNDRNKSSLEVPLGDLVGSIRLNDLPAGECRRVITGRMESLIFNTQLFDGAQASGYARTSITPTGFAMMKGKLASYMQVIPITAATRVCDDGNGMILPIQTWLPHQETFSGWLAVPTSSEAIQPPHELGWNFERFVGHPALERRFTARSARFTPPSPGQSLLGPDGQTNTLKITFYAGETQFILLTPSNKIIPSEGQSYWLSPVYGRHLQSASINPRTGIFTARTWNPALYPEATLRQGTVEGIVLNAQEKLYGFWVNVEKDNPDAVPVQIEVVPQP